MPARWMLRRFGQRIKPVNPADAIRALGALTDS
jgi:hypothetical protein